jgi:hypothetical protein
MAIVFSVATIMRMVGNKAQRTGILKSNLERWSVSTKYLQQHARLTAKQSAARQRSMMSGIQTTKRGRLHKATAKYKLTQGTAMSKYIAIQKRRDRGLSAWICFQRAW